MNKKLFRCLFFLVLIFAPAAFCWWLFLPLAALLVFLAKSPYEAIAAGALLDLFYYFGDSFWQKHELAIFSLLLVALAAFLETKVYWRKFI